MSLGFAKGVSQLRFLLQRSPEIVVELFKSNKVSGTMKPQVPITCEFLHFFHSFAIFSVVVADNPGPWPKNCAVLCSPVPSLFSLVSPLQSQGAKWEAVQDIEHV